MDAVARYLAQWAAVKPGLDVAPMAIMGRLHRSAALVEARLDTVFHAHGVQGWEFDVMAALRRAGEPYELTPGRLDRETMMTSGTTTHRLKRLEQRGLVSRRTDADDRRVVHVRLTAQGLALFDRVHPAHVENERAILDRLDPADREALLRGLAALSEALETPEDGP